MIGRGKRHACESSQQDLGSAHVLIQQGSSVCLTCLLRSLTSDRRHGVHALLQALYVAIFIFGISSLSVTMLVAILAGSDAAAKVSVGYLALAPLALVLRLIEAYYLIGGLTQVFRGWQDRVGFWASWALLIVIHATFFMGVFEKLALVSHLI